MTKPIVLLLALCCVSACCPSVDHVEPPYPDKVKGWEKTDDPKSEVDGSFVLRKGEETSNGKITIRVVDILPGNGCAHSGEFQRSVRAKLRFIRTRDQRVICEDEFADQGFTQMSGPPCGDQLRNFGITVVTINAISLKDGWVYLLL